MIRRCKRINFRLTLQEEERFAPLMRQLHLWGWSELCRTALKRLATAEEQRTSDNNVIQPIACQTPPAVSDASTKKGRRSASGKPGKAGKK